MMAVQRGSLSRATAAYGAHTYTHTHAREVEKESERDAMLALKGSHHKGGSENNAAAAARERRGRDGAAANGRGARRSRLTLFSEAQAALHFYAAYIFLGCRHIFAATTLKDCSLAIYVQHTCKVRCALLCAQAQRALILFLVYVWRVQSLCCAPTAGIIRLIAAGAQFKSALALIGEFVSVPAGDKSYGLENSQNTDAKMIVFISQVNLELLYRLYSCMHNGDALESYWWEFWY
jgi:hypothetical protein